MATQVRPGQLGIAVPFGNLLGSSTNEMNAELRDYQELGVDWVRIDIHWTLVQPNGSGSYNWSQVDKVFNAIQDHGMKVVAVLNNTPHWVNKNMSSWSDQDAFGRFAAAAANRYDDIVDHWEIFNEQNKHGISPQNYTKMLQQAYNAIKAVDSTDVVITGGTAAVPSTGNGMWGAVDYLKQMYDSGAKGYFDAVGHHPYSYPLMPSNSASYNGWQMMEDGIRQTMVNNGDGHKQVWMTEFGAKTTGGNGTTVSNTQAANMLREAVDLAQDNDWAGPIMWYSYQDNNLEPGFGLRDGNGNTRAAYHAFKELGNKDNDGSSPAPSSPSYAPSPSPAPSGNSGNGNTIQGTSGNDRLQGTSGNDILRDGGGGQDIMTGGGGSDIFVFEKAGKWDQIRDFQKGSDKIDLSRIDANTEWSGHQDFKFIGSNWLSKAGDLGVYRNDAHNKTYILGNIDGDKEEEISIVLNGIHYLEASDFIF